MGSAQLVRRRDRGQQHASDMLNAEHSAQLGDRNHNRRRRRSNASPRVLGAGMDVICLCASARVLRAMCAWLFGRTLSPMCPFYLSIPYVCLLLFVQYDSELALPFLFTIQAYYHRS